MWDAISVYCWSGKLTCYFFHSVRSRYIRDPTVPVRTLYQVEGVHGMTDDSMIFSDGVAQTNSLSQIVKDGERQSVSTYQKDLPPVPFKNMKNSHTRWRLRKTYVIHRRRFLSSISFRELHPRSYSPCECTHAVPLQSHCCDSQSALITTLLVPVKSNPCTGTMPIRWADVNGESLSGLRHIPVWYVPLFCSRDREDGLRSSKVRFEDHAYS